MLFIIIQPMDDACSHDCPSSPTKLNYFEAGLEVFRRASSG